MSRIRGGLEFRTVLICTRCSRKVVVTEDEEEDFGWYAEDTVCDCGKVFDKPNDLAEEHRRVGEPWKGGEL